MADKPKRPWRSKPLNELTVEEMKQGIEEGEIDIPTTPAPDPADLYTLDRLEKLVLGEITWAQFQGMTHDEAYNIAEYGYALYEEGRYHDSRVVFESLVLANPYDAYFHTMLGAVYQQLDMREEAAEEYTTAIELDSDHLNAYVNRGELLLLNGEFERALPDLRRAIELDPEAKNPVAIRARALVKATAAALQDVANEKKKR